MSANIEELSERHAKECAYSAHDKIGLYPQDQMWVFNVAKSSIRSALTELSETHALELRAYETTVANLDGRIRVLSDALAGLVAIAHDSDGVAGYHKNGDIADWYSFPEFEAAVIAIDAAAPSQENV